ncbi:MAG: Hsp20/alpha crystallin family protein [Nodosilinea sp.]
MARLLWSSMWDLDLAAAQLQRDRVMAALAPFSFSTSGRLQVTSIEIQETPEALTVTAFFPGVDPTTVDVRATPRSLMFLGQQSIPNTESYLYSWTMRPFQQSLVLPVTVRDRQIQVSYQTGGALVVTLPRQIGFWRPLEELSRKWQQGIGWRIGPWLRQVKKQLGQRLRQWSDLLLGEDYQGQ